MFKANQPNPYDDIVAKATDENLTGENWEVILNLCDKVQEEGEQGARNVIAALLKRLAHRSPNVQLYALSLGESLSKNCGIDLHRELASRAFTGALEKLIVDRTTHEKVRRRALGLIAMWTAEFEHDPTLGIMESCYNNLKAKSYQFETPSEPAPPSVDDEARRREEEELQRALEISMRDKGGRSTYAPTASAGSSGAAAKHASGYVPARSPSPKAPAYAANNYHSNTKTTSTSGYSATSGGVSAIAASSTSSLPSQASAPVVTRVRALHTFEPTEPGELAFEKGEVIKVVDRGYKDWWRGQLKGRTGIFPVNYVEPLPEPTAAELAREAEQEAAVFAQAANVDRLLSMLRNLDASRDNLADNEEIQELYRSCMALRPKIVKLIDKYNQKRADLVSMNESFVKARTIFDRIMEDSLARHTAMYDSGPHPAQPYGYGYDQPQPYGYGGPNNAYQHQPEHQPQSQPYPGPPQQPDPAYAYQQGQVYGVHVGGAPYPQPAQTPYPQTSQTHYPQQQPQQQPHLQQQPHPQQQQPQTQQPAEYLPGVHAQQPQPQLQPQTQQQPQMAGPPYVFDPNATYPDPNAQAWAQYYAQGGTDTAGAVYFISVPGVSDAPSPPEQTPQSHQPSLDPYQAQAQQSPAQQEAMHQSPTSQHATYMSPNSQQSQYSPQPYYQDPASAPQASAPQVSPTTATGGIPSLQRTSSVTASVPTSYSYHSPSPQQQLSQTGQNAYAGPGSEGHGYPPPASDGYGPPVAGSYAQSALSGPGHGSSPSREYPQGPGAHGGVHALQNQFLDMSIGGPQVATS